MVTHAKPIKHEVKPTATEHPKAKVIKVAMPAHHETKPDVVVLHKKPKA